MPVEPRTPRGVRVVRRRLLGVILPAAGSLCKWRGSQQQSNPKVRSDTRSVIFERGRRGQTLSDSAWLESFEAVSLQSGWSAACHRVDRRQCRTVEPNIGRQRRIPSRGFGLRDACVLCPFNRGWRGELPTRRLAEPNLLMAMVAYFGAQHRLGIGCLVRNSSSNRPGSGGRQKCRRVNSSTMNGAKALASELPRRRCRTANNRRRGVRGSFCVLPPEIVGNGST